MVPEFSRVYIPSFVVGDQMTAKSQLEWTDVEDDSYKLDSYGLMVCLIKAKVCGLMVRIAYVT